MDNQILNYLWTLYSGIVKWISNYSSESQLLSFLHKLVVYIFLDKSTGTRATDLSLVVETGHMREENGVID